MKKIESSYIVSRLLTEEKFNQDSHSRRDIYLNLE